MRASTCWAMYRHVSDLVSMDSFMDYLKPRFLSATAKHGGKIPLNLLAIFARSIQIRPLISSISPIVTTPGLGSGCLRLSHVAAADSNPATKSLSRSSCIKPPIDWLMLWRPRAVNKKARTLAGFVVASGWRYIAPPSIPAIIPASGLAGVRGFVLMSGASVGMAAAGSGISGAASLSWPPAER